LDGKNRFNLSEYLTVDDQDIAYQFPFGRAPPTSCPQKLGSFSHNIKKKKKNQEKTTCIYH
jgi:hypothetical protein